MQFRGKCARRRIIFLIASADLDAVITTFSGLSDHIWVYKVGDL